MANNRKLSGTTSGIPAGLGIGALLSLVCTLAGSAILAKLIDQEIVAEDAIGYGVIVILLISSFLGTIAAYGRIRRQRAMVCALSGAVYYLTLLAITALFFGGQYTGMGVTALVVLAGSGCAILLGMGKGRGGRQRNYTKQLRKIVQSDHR